MSAAVPNDTPGKRAMSVDQSPSEAINANSAIHAPDTSALTENYQSAAASKTDTRPRETGTDHVEPVLNLKAKSIKKNRDNQNVSPGTGLNGKNASTTAPTENTHDGVATKDTDELRALTKRTEKSKKRTRKFKNRGKKTRGREAMEKNGKGRLPIRIGKTTRMTNDPVMYRKLRRAVAVRQQVKQAEALLAQSVAFLSAAHRILARMKWVYK